MRRDERPAFSWAAFFLVLWLQLIVAWGIGAARWTRGLDVLVPVAAAGVVTGTLLGRSRWPGVLGVLYGMVTGALLNAFAVASLLPEGLSLHDRMVNLYYRLNAWLAKILAGEFGSDALIFVLMLGFILWWAAAYAGWSVFRREDPWWAGIPGGIVLTVNVYYGPPRLRPYIGFYLFVALLLALWMNFLRQERDWARHRVGYTPYIALDYIRYGVVFIAAVLALSLMAPHVESATAREELFKAFRRPWQRVQEEWNRLFNPLRTYRAPEGGPVAFGDELILGGPVAFGERLVMEIETEPRYAGRYWRAVAYDTYTGRGWLNTDQTRIPLGAGDYPPMPPFEARAPLTQTYFVVEPAGNLLFAAYQPAKVIIPAWAYVYEIPGPEGEGRPVIEPSQLYARRYLDEGSRYKVVSLISAATEDMLRSAGTEYPEWVLSRYLQLPPELPERVRELAQSVAPPESSPYERATAIERYLRSNYLYNERIPPPPPDRDAVDYFLFDLRQGYCNYYASAMVVMLRAIGIPARLATGYARGEMDPATGRLKVRDKHAHAWVEAVFPRYGWVEFEPTPSQPPIVRPRTPGEVYPRATPPRPERIPEDVEVPEGPGPAPAPVPAVGVLTRWFPWLRRPMPRWLPRAALAVALVMLAGWALRRTLEPPHLSTAARLYLRVVRLGRIAGVPLEPYQTPLEYAAQVKDRLSAPAGAVETIAALYAKERFGGYVLSEREQEALALAWKSLFPRVTLAVATALVRRVARPHTRFRGGLPYARG